MEVIMPVWRLEEYLKSNNISYKTVIHSPAYTSQEIAASVHMSGKKLAKSVIIKIDNIMTMFVLPAHEKVNLDMIAEISGAAKVVLASEDEFKARFPFCETGAMPPFGNLYGMEVYVAPDLKDTEIVFNAGNHRELIIMKYDDFAGLVKPKVMESAAVAV
jgi:Ala-tRNA(Pro) deacylase